MSRLVLGPTQPSVQCVLEFFPGCEVNLSLPSAKVKNEWSHTSVSPVCLHDVDRENPFTFIVTDFNVYNSCCFVINTEHVVTKQ